jgi:hypothetical protein
VISNPTTISDLTATSDSVSVTQVEHIYDEDSNEHSSAIIESSLNGGQQSSSSIGNSSAVASSTGNANTVKKNGRPKGSTDAKKYDDKVNLSSALNFIAYNMKQKKEEAASVGRKVKYGTYDGLVENARVRFNLPEDVLIPVKRRCLQRVNRKNRSVLVAHRGKISPMVQVEAHLVDIILNYSRMRQPITPKVGLALANSMIKGTEIECEMIEWRKKSLPNSVVGKYDPDFEVAVDG